MLYKRTKSGELAQELATHGQGPVKSEGSLADASLLETSVLESLRSTREARGGLSLQNSERKPWKEACTGILLPEL